MNKLIQDIVPPKKVWDEVAARDLSTEVLVTEIWERGVTIKEMFGYFYALEEMATHRFDTPLTVEDAELAGYADLPDKPIPRQPF